jgi:hypothetical protein
MRIMSEELRLKKRVKEKNVNNIDIDRNYSTGKLYAKGRKECGK